MAVFDATLYETLPQTNVAATLALMRAVLTASKGMTLPAAKKALKRVRAVGEDLRSLYQAAPPARTESLTKEADVSMDRIWGAVERRLAAHIELGDDAGAEAERIHALLFPNGMSFLTSKYAEQWAEGDAILARIESEELEGSLQRLVGAAFLQALRERHAAYGEALGITKARPFEEDAVTLVEPLRRARAAITTYTRVLIAAVDNGDFDEKQAMSALAPIAALRDSMRSTKKKETEPNTPPQEPPGMPEPLPPVDEADATTE